MISVATSLYDMSFADQKEPNDPAEVIIFDPAEVIIFIPQGGALSTFYAAQTLRWELSQRPVQLQFAEIAEYQLYGFGVGILARVWSAVGDLLDQERRGKARLTYENDILAGWSLDQTFIFEKYGVALIYTVSDNTLFISCIDVDPPPSGGHISSTPVFAENEDSEYLIFAASNIWIPSCGADSCDQIEPDSGYPILSFNWTEGDALIQTETGTVGANLLGDWIVFAAGTTWLDVTTDFDAPGGGTWLIYSYPHNYTLSNVIAFCCNDDGTVVSAGSVASVITITETITYTFTAGGGEFDAFTVNLSTGGGRAVAAECEGMATERFSGWFDVVEFTPAGARVTGTGTATSVWEDVVIFWPTRDGSGAMAGLYLASLGAWLDEIGVAALSLIGTNMTGTGAAASAREDTMDGSINTNSAANQIEAIYVAYFGRGVDGPDYSFWTKRGRAAVPSYRSETTAVCNITDNFAARPNARGRYDFLALTVTAAASTSGKSAGSGAMVLTGGGTTTLSGAAGSVAVLSLGWGFGNGLRAEVEGDYCQNIHQGSFGVQEQLAGGIVNVLYDFVGIVPVGLGIGYQAAILGNYKTTIGATTLISSRANQGGLGYQAILGIALPISAMPGLAITSEYCFLALVGSRSHSCSATTGAVTVPYALKLNNDYNHCVLLGLRYAFGAPAPAAMAGRGAVTVASARTATLFGVGTGLAMDGANGTVSASTGTITAPVATRGSGAATLTGGGVAAALFDAGTGPATSGTDVMIAVTPGAEAAALARRVPLIGRANGVALTPAAQGDILIARKTVEDTMVTAKDRPVTLGTIIGSIEAARRNRRKEIGFHSLSWFCRSGCPKKTFNSARDDR